MVDSLAPTVIEEFQGDSDLFDDNDVTDPAGSPFADASEERDTGEQAPLAAAAETPAPSVTLPEVSSRPPGVPSFALAALVDGLAAGAPALLTAFAVNPDKGAPFLERVIHSLVLTPSALVAFVVVATLVSTMQHIALVPRLGTTVGGLVGGVAIRTRDGHAPTLAKAAIRGAVTALSAIAFLAGPLYALWVDDGRRALADRVAGTRLFSRRRA